MKSDNNPGDSVDLLVFTTGDRLFAMNSGDISEITDKAPVTPAPFTDDFVSGLVSIAGQILPQIELQALLNGTRAEGRYEELIVLRGERLPCVIAVSKVQEKVSVAAEDISSVASGDDMPHNGFVLGEFQWHDSPVIVLSAQAISSLVLAKDMEPGESAFLAPEETGSNEAVTERFPFLRLSAGKETYALPMDQALEIVEAGEFSPIPGAPHFIRGLTLVRDQSLLVASASALLGLGEIPEQVVVVVQLGDIRAGISVTAVESVLSVPEDRIRRFNDPESRMAGVVHTEDESILGLLSTQQLFTANEQKAVAAHTPHHRRIAGQERIVITRSVLEVEQGSQHFGIPVSSIERIIDYQAPRPLPSDNRLITGAIEHESRVLPVLSGDLLCPVEEDSSYAAFVILSDGQSRQWALPVQQASRIRDVDESTINSLEQRDGGLIREVAQFQGRLLSMVNPSALTDLERPDLQQEPAS